MKGGITEGLKQEVVRAAIRQEILQVNQKPAGQVIFHLWVYLAEHRLCPEIAP